MSRLILGLQPVREAVRARGADLERVLIERNSGDRLDGVRRFAEDRGARVEIVTRAELDRLAGGVRHQGVAAIAKDLGLARIEDLDTGPECLVVALDGVMDPQNFGAVIRSAVALGATAVVWAEHASAPLTPATFRASAGAVEHARLCRVPSLPSALDLLQQRGVTAVALDGQGDRDLDAVDLRGPVALVVGAEDKGSRRSVRRACSVIARLPMHGPIASLNASVAGALAVYEVQRQRRAARSSIPPATRDA
ncbi:MAG TPA: RNA methyltransferase [Byssovorax sp.]